MRKNVSSTKQKLITFVLEKLESGELKEIPALVTSQKDFDFLMSYLKKEGTLPFFGKERDSILKLLKKSFPEYLI